MAVVLPSEEDNYFSSALRRSHSLPKLGSPHSRFHKSSSTSQLGDFLARPRGDFPRSANSSLSSSSSSSPPVTQAVSESPSVSSTPATNFSLASDYDDATAPESVTPEDVLTLHYGGGGYFGHPGNQEPPPSPQGGEPNASPVNEQDDDSTATSRPGSPDVLERAEDDIALRVQPSRHVDYFSHDWREEDIWSSWKLIVSKRGEYNNSARLENASWRTWMKSKNNLGTVSAETLNWLKDHDVTWLYGPLQSGSSTLNTASTSSNSTKLSKSNSFNKKPILKRRTMSEILLQRSLSTSSLVKQAAEAVQAQQKGGLKRTGRRPGLERAHTDYLTFQLPSRGLSHDGTSAYPSTRSSGLTSPNSGRKHIHFNEQVSQCIAVDVKGEDDDDEEDDYGDRYQYDSDSDDGAIMMRLKPKKRRPVLKRTKSRSAGGESKTIAMLPSTTLKYREDTPEPAEPGARNSSGALRSPLLSPSSSQETLRPSRRSGSIFFAGGDEDDDEEEEDVDNEEVAGTADNASQRPGGSGLRRSVSSASLAGEPAGMRRTPSGMFMPLEEGDPRAPNDGLIGRIIDTKEAASSSTHRHRQHSRSFQGLYDSDEEHWDD